MSASDLADYRADWVDTIGVDYHGHRLHEIPPNGQGISALMALGILKHHDIGSLHARFAAVARHLQIEAMKCAFADVYTACRRPARMKVTPARPARSRPTSPSARADPRDRAIDFEHGTPPAGGTIYLTAADERGMMVSFIQSNYMGFGSGVVVPGTGVSLQNRGFGFSTDPSHPNVVAPRKRPFQTIIPAFLTRAGEPVMSFGVMGGNMQPQGHLQTLLRVVDWKQNPQAACDAPRFKVSAASTSTSSRRWRRRRRVAALAAWATRSPRRKDTYMDFGSGQFIWRLGDPGIEGYVAASDSRRDGHAAAIPSGARERRPPRLRTSHRHVTRRTDGASRPPPPPPPYGEAAPCPGGRMRLALDGSTAT